MPAGDGTGPDRKGSKTGRGLGYCAGYSSPGFTKNPGCGLSRGFGVSAGKSFFLTYILFYVLSWLQFPQIYKTLEANGLGIINFGLLLLFFYAIFKFVKFEKD